MHESHLPAFPFGAVYFRKSNPPRKDWERDYATAAEDGINIFRHWFLWLAIETSPGNFDWDDYDRQLDLAAEHGITTIIADKITAAPEWAYRKFAHARFEARDGRRFESTMNGSCVVSGFPGLCLDNDDYREAAGEFLRRLAERYRNHPGLGGYDLWNECNISPDVCYCPATAARFREWIAERHTDLESLERAWHRYSFAEWDNVMPPRYLGPYPDVLDWLQFRIENAYRNQRWRVDLVRGIDGEHPITAHGIAGSLTSLAPGAADDWRAAAEVESYGVTWVACRKGDEPWKQAYALDLVRAASRGKPFWHAEAQGGPLWMQPQVIGRPREDGRIASPEDMRYWHLTSFMAGARGLLYNRWRPLLDGPLFGAFGPYGMNGSRTDRSEMTSVLAKWANDPAQGHLWRSRPVSGDIGILVVPETQIFAYAQQGDTDLYSSAMLGAYRGFHAGNIQADWVHIDHIDEYDLLYLPFPIMLSAATADRIRTWVERGGTLISEGCPAYFGDGGRVGTVQPNHGLDELFGAREAYVEFTPDILEDVRFVSGGLSVPGGVFLQAFEPTSGTAAGWYEDGTVAVVDHAFGAGRTRLIGTMAGAGYGRNEDPGGGAFFAGCLAFGAKTQHVECSDPNVWARLHDGDGGRYLWVANPLRREVPVRVRLSEALDGFSAARPLWGEGGTIDGSTLDMSVEGRNVSILELV